MAHYNVFVMITLFYDPLVEEIVIKLSRKGISGEDAKDQLKRYLSKFLKGECAG